MIDKLNLIAVHLALQFIPAVRMVALGNPQSGNKS